MVVVDELIETWIAVGRYHHFILVQDRFRLFLSAIVEGTEADFMAEMADKVYYIPMYEADVNVADSIEVLREKPVSVEGSLKVQELVTDRNRYDVDGVFFF